MKTAKKFLAVLMALAMIVSLGSGMAVSVHASDLKEEPVQEQPVQEEPVVEKYTLTFVTNKEGVTVAPISVPVDAESKVVTLPALSQEGFKGWEIGGVLKAAGTTIELTGNVVATASWKTAATEEAPAEEDAAVPEEEENAVPEEKADSAPAEEQNAAPAEEESSADEGQIENVTEESAEQASEESAEQASEESAEQAPEEPAEQVTEEPAEQASEESAEQAPEEPAEQAPEKSAEQVSEKPAEQVSEEPAEQASEESAEQVTEESAEQATEEVTEKETEAVTEKETEAVTEKETEAVTEKETEKVTEKETEKVTEKETEKVTEKETEKVTETATEAETEAAPEMLNATSEWTNGSSEAATFRSSAPLSAFTAVTVDGVVVDPSNYTLREGSTIVIFKDHFLKSLSNGKHVIAILSNVDGEDVSAAAEIEIKGNPENKPAKPDNTCKPEKEEAKPHNHKPTNHHDNHHNRHEKEEAEYEIIKATHTWLNTSKHSASFTSSAPRDTFIRVEVDGRRVHRGDFSVDGRKVTEVTLHASFLKGLKVGTHFVTIVSEGEDGEAVSASVRFTVKQGSPTPKTGDTANDRLWVTMIVASCAVMAIVMTSPKRKEG